ncbi:4853_t:CDS:2 [Cetraspora pellucida]|uniref:4853_t:CDS:1 n=1 Tax=Cetraspora pellucida TaxID=1433469 RepID=A0ACA9KMT5_9GLOM|nr:4853_t:CDS:2 [Cetraspora pellucida]
MPAWYWKFLVTLAKKALSLMIRLNCDDEFFDIMKEFISSKTHELKLLEENKDASNVESQPAITNPFVTKHRGRPPKRYKSSLEHVTNTQNNKHSSITNNNGTQEKNRNKCANCGNYGHNVRTCTYED